jgi:hypothetical protein
LKKSLHIKGAGGVAQGVCPEFKSQFCKTKQNKTLNPQRINIPMKKWAHELNREFLKEDVQMANRYVEKCSTSLAIKEMQIKTPQRFHLTPIKMAIFRGKNNNKCWWGCSKTGTLICCW